MKKTIKRKKTKRNKHIPLEITLLAAVIFAGVSLYMLRLSAPAPTAMPVAVSAPASLTLTAPSGGTANVGQIQQVKWLSENYTAPTVSVDVIRKVSDNPATYEVVRTIVAAKSNNGDAVWVPAKTDIGDNTLIQVGCASSVQACTAGVSPSALAVVDDGQYDNMANVYQSIEALYNK